MNEKYSQLLLQKYKGLKRVIEVDSCYDYSELKQRLGKAAASFLDEIILEYKNPGVGVGGGSTLYETINHLDNKNRRIRIYPTAIIGRGPEISHVDSSFLATMLYFKSQPQARAFVVNIPPLPNTKSKAMKFLKDLKKDFEELKWLTKAMQEIDIAFVGLGAMIPTGDFMDELEKLGVSLTELKERGVTGGINYNWFENNGNQVADYFPTLNIKRLIELSSNNKKNITLVAGGPHKVDPIRIALSNGMVNNLVTDSQVTKLLLEE